MSDARPAPPSGGTATRQRARFAAAGVLLTSAALAGTGYSWEPVRAEPERFTASPEEAARIRKLERDLTRLTPRGYHIVVDQTHNLLELRRGEAVVHAARCSAGSGYVLRERGPEGRRWVFDTPRGVFHVRHKSVNPVWRKPDWAFVEAGEPIPEDPGDRFEYGVLGRYALDIGEGYLIHGTLYERLLGRSVTHGCIRLGRDDLRRLYETVPLGAPVIIY